MPSTTKRIGKLSFKDLPLIYEALCRLYLPRPIKTRAACAEATELIDALVGYDLSRDQEDYLEALSTFVHEYESRLVEEPPIEPLEILLHLLEENGLATKDLAAILKVDTSLATRILKGKRSITPEHAKRLGEHFKVRPGLFLGIK
jgi:HTH-type transcriptional regulator / antitoxin HigA